MNHSHLSSVPPKSLENESDEEDQEFNEKLSAMEGHRKECISEGKYVEAQMVQNRLNELKVERSNRKLERLLENHENEVF